MSTFSGVGRVIAATVLTTGLGFAAMTYSAAAQDVSPEQIKAARATLDALSATAEFDNILPNMAEQLKSEYIQASPNYQDIISATVDDKALSLAPRRSDLENEAASIYAKTFTLEELNQITAFYTSPAGKKLLQDGPIASRELYKAAQIWASGISRDMAKESEGALEKIIGQKMEPGIVSPPADAPATDTPPAEAPKK
jgi:uncharacterized protein